MWLVLNEIVYSWTVGAVLNKQLGVGLSVIRGLQIGLFAFTFMVVSNADASSGVIDSLNPNGLRLGGFNLFPILTGGYRMDDNIYASETALVSDTTQVVRTGLGLISNWSRHSLYINGGGSVGRFAENRNEDYDDYNLALGGNIGILKGMNLSVNGGHNILHEDRGSPDEANGIRPTNYTLSTASLNLSHAIGRLSATVGGTLHDFKYEDTPTTGTTVNNSDRARAQYIEMLKLAYELSPGYEVVLKTSLNQRNYNEAVDDNGEERNSTGQEILGGVDLNFGDPFKAELLAGYATQDYLDANLGDVSDISYGMRLTWMPTRLTTVRSNMVRSVEETTSQGSSSIFTSMFSLGVRHALMRSLSVGFDIGRGNLEYQGTTRIDTNTTVATGIIYKTNRYLHVVADYNIKMRSSNITGMDYSRSQATISLGGHI